MDFDVLSNKEHEKVIQNGNEILHIFYKAHLSLQNLSFKIYRIDEKYVICSEQVGAYGPVQSLTEALQWNGFEYTIEDFELSSTVLSNESLKSLEKVFLDRMNEMALNHPSLISGVDPVILWEAIDLHLKNESKLDCSDLKNFLAPKSVYGEVFLDKIILLTVEKRYLKILFKYGIDTIQLLMEYFLRQEDYLVCKEIHEMVMEHNRKTDNNLRSIR